MLSKLIKHEFRATSRIMWPVFLGMLALTALMRFSQLLLNGGHIPWLLQLIGVLLVIGFVMGLFALAFAPLVLSAVRWRDHVLKDEGYLTLTLPVSLHQLLISKLIVSAVWYAAAFIVGLLSLLIAASGWSTFQYVPDFFNDVFTAFFEMEASLRSHALLIVFELFCNFVFAVSAAELVVYAAFSIGYSFNKHKTLWTTILVLVFFEVAQFTAIAMIGAFFNADPTRWMNLDIHSAPASVELLLLWGMFGELLFAAAGYAVTWYFTTKKLNLEERVFEKAAAKGLRFSGCFFAPFFRQNFSKSKSYVNRHLLTHSFERSHLMQILTVSGLQKTYTTRFGGSKVHALKNVNFTVEFGEYVAIMGESGSGKTTLLNILAALDKPTGGTVLLGGKNLSEIPEETAAAFRRDNLGFVFQDFSLLDTFSLEDNICLPLVLAGKSRTEMRDRLSPLAYDLGIETLLKKYPYEVSGGQKQRAAVARALITRPQILLADEPTGALDSRSTDELLKLFGEINASGQTIVMVTHSVRAASCASRVLFLRDGEVSLELKRGKDTDSQFYQRITDALTQQQTGGECA